MNPSKQAHMKKSKPRANVPKLDDRLADIDINGLSDEQLELISEALGRQIKAIIDKAEQDVSLCLSRYGLGAKMLIAYLDKDGNPIQRAE